MASPLKGEATLTDAQAADLAAGKWYFNIHTAANKGGEIRGQVMKGHVTRVGEGARGWRLLAPISIQRAIHGRLQVGRRYCRPSASAARCR